jgi:hypothetical protein
MNRELAEQADIVWDLQDKAINTFALPYGSKQPERGSKWKELTKRRTTNDEIRESFCSGVRRNIAMVCGWPSGVMAIDADSLEAARALFRALPRTPAMEKTAKGVHFILQLPKGLIVPPAVKTTIKGIQCDIRGEASYIVVAPSMHPSGKQYEWVNWPWNLQDVPEFDPAWIDEPLQKMQQLGKAEQLEITRRDVYNVDAYLAHIESVQGQGGSRGLVRAAAVCRDAGLSEAEAMVSLIEWNRGPTVKPAWTPKELARAVTRVFRK